MPDETPVFLVNPYSEPVVIRINGRANYLNSGPLREFFAMLMGQGRRRVVVDFRNCLSVDSTFLGIVAGTALEMMDLEPPGEMILMALGTRNLELIRNLGLHRIATIVDSFGGAAEATSAEHALGADKIDKEERVRMIVDAHTKLIQCDESNAERFQDVIAFMRKRSGWEHGE
jgi:anti-sigma B factor antagonist